MFTDARPGKKMEYSYHVYSVHSNIPRRPPVRLHTTRTEFRWMRMMREAWLILPVCLCVLCGYPLTATDRPATPEWSAKITGKLGQLPTVWRCSIRILNWYVPGTHVVFPLFSFCYLEEFWTRPVVARGNCQQRNCANSSLRYIVLKLFEYWILTSIYFTLAARDV